MRLRLFVDIDGLMGEMLQTKGYSGGVGHSKGLSEGVRVHSVGFSEGVGMGYIQMVCLLAKL